MPARRRAAELSLDAAALGDAADPARVLDGPRDPAHRRDPRAKIANDHERAQLEVTATAVIERTEDAYWDVVQTLYSYNLELRSQQRADEQMALTKRQIAAGLLPPGDSTSAEATLASRQLAVVQAELAVEASWDALRAVLNLPRDQWSRPILPTDTPSFARRDRHARRHAEARDCEPARARAGQARHPVRGAGGPARRTTTACPRSISASRAASSARTRPTAARSREYGRADASAYSVFVNFTWTPLQRATRAAAEIERTRLNVAAVHRDQTLQDIWVAVREAVRTQAGAARQVFAAAKFRDLSTKNLEIEQRKFLSGQSSNFVVAQRQEELAQAQLAEVTAVLGHKKATAALLRATGRLLERTPRLASSSPTRRAAPGSDRGGAARIAG